MKRRDILRALAALPVLAPHARLLARPEQAGASAPMLAGWWQPVRPLRCWCIVWHPTRCQVGLFSWLLLHAA